jgi:hypothetical protein
LSWLWGREAFTPPSSLGFFVVGHLSLVVKMVFLDGFFSLLFESSDLWVVEVFVAPVCIRWVF